MALLAVVGAHLAGQPLNHQLTDRGARLCESTETAPNYRLFALPTVPPKPGLVRTADPSTPDPGAGAIEVEVWELDDDALGSFVQGIPAPLCVGTVELADGRTVLGFLCEQIATQGTPEITRYGGWRSFLRASNPD
jgi:allophanate hydrolase